MIPSRSLSPFRRNTNNDNTNSDKKKKRTSLRIVTGDSTANNEQPTSPTTSRVRQRLSSLFRSTSTPITTKQQDKRTSTLSLSKSIEEKAPVAALTLEDNKSTDSLSSSSDNSDHMPASPADFNGNNHSGLWKNNNYLVEEPKQVMSPAPLPPVHQFNSLAYQIHQVLGSTINEVDEEIDLDWEYSRTKLRQSLTPLPKSSHLIHF